jgi:SAM-dependent methyltransferase
VMHRKRPVKATKLKWTDDHHLRVGNANFLVTLDSDIWETADPDSDEFVLLKNRGMVERLLRVAPAPVENIVDLGIFKGGSVALLQEVFSPQRIVGVDWSADRAEVLDRFIARHSLSDRVGLYYDTSQGDQDRLSWILQENFGKQSLDLVIDDCSHTYEMTRASLNILLPRLRPGGLYVIEDWGWAHWPDEYWQGSKHPMVDERIPLSKLMLELVMVSASRPRLVSELTVWQGVAYLTRGDEAVSDAGFDISKSYATAGRQIFHEAPVIP